VFEGEKEFHQNVKLWGVSIMLSSNFFSDEVPFKIEDNCVVSTDGKFRCMI
jgi:hypothetical protein